MKVKPTATDFEKVKAIINKMFCRPGLDGDPIANALAAERATLLAEVMPGVKKMTVRLEILTGRMKACHEETGKHELIEEADMFCHEARALLARLKELGE